MLSGSAVDPYKPNQRKGATTLHPTKCSNRQVCLFWWYVGGWVRIPMRSFYVFSTFLPFLLMMGYIMSEILICNFFCGLFLMWHTSSSCQWCGSGFRTLNAVVWADLSKPPRIHNPDHALEEWPGRIPCPVHEDWFPVTDLLLWTYTALNLRCSESTCSESTCSETTTISDVAYA